MYSQNSEEKFIVEYFDGQTGTLLSIGENDGQTFSNALRLIELGWSAVLVEPSPQAFAKLNYMHICRLTVHCFNIAIGNYDGVGILHESGAHVRHGKDVALVSSLKSDETAKWRSSGVGFKDEEVNVSTYATLIAKSRIKEFDFITIDAEGMDLDILQQIDLSNVKLLCIEWNGKQDVRAAIIAYCASFGMYKLITENIENIIVGR